MNAMANKAGGKGYESDKYYENISFSFKVDILEPFNNNLQFSELGCFLQQQTSISQQVRAKYLEKSEHGSLG